MTDLTSIINAVIALAAALISAFVIPWLRRKTSAEDREELLKWVEIAVAAAQQLYHHLDGAKRKEYVLAFLSERGYTLEGPELDAAIEAAVLRLHRELEAANGNR